MSIFSLAILNSLNKEEVNPRWALLVVEGRFIMVTPNEIAIHGLVNLQE